MKNILIYMGICAVFLINSGCASYMNYNRWEKAKDEKALVVNADGETVYVGVNLTAIDYLKEDWPMALGAAVVDGILFYGTYKIYDNNFGSSGGGSNSDSSTDITIQSDSGRDTSIIINSGSGNTFGEQGDAIDTTTF